MASREYGEREQQQQQGRWEDSSVGRAQGNPSWQAGNHGFGRSGGLGAAGGEFAGRGESSGMGPGASWGSQPGAGIGGGSWGSAQGAAWGGGQQARITTSLAVAALALALGSAFAQTGATGTGSGAGSSAPTTTGTAPVTQGGSGTRNTPAPSAKVARSDRKFIEQAASSGLFELQAAQLAAVKATDPAVKSYATQLADHHSAANGELMALANSLGLELPPAPKRSMRNQIEKLGQKTGPEFDREFVRNVGVKEHERDLKAFQKAAKDVKDPQLKAWIDKTLPVLQQHLAAAQNLPAAGDKAAEATRSDPGRMGAGPNPAAPAAGTYGPGGAGGSSGSNKSGS